jgi:hypothetical protein
MTAKSEFYSSIASCTVIAQTLSSDKGIVSNINFKKRQQA